MPYEILVTIGIAVVGLVVIFSLVMSMWKKIPNDKAGIISGFRKQRVITGGGTLLIPGLERMDIISLENIPLVVKTQNSMTIKGVPITVDSTAAIKIKSEEAEILKAFEQFNTGRVDSTVKRIEETLRSVLEGNLREVIGKMTVEEIYQDREKFSEQTRDVVKTSLEVMGFELIVFTIRDIDDPNDYLKSLGARQIAEVRKAAAIAEAEAEKERKVKISEANKEGEEARIASETAIAQAEKDKQVKEAEFRREQETARARAEAAFAIEDNKVKKEIITSQADADVLKQQRQKEVTEAELQVEVVREQKNIELARTKAEVAEQTLVETVVNPAKAAQEKAKVDAEAKKVADVKAAEARAEATRVEAEAEAGAISAKGKAEAEAIKLRLEAEADGMLKKAEAYERYGSAAMTQMIVEKLPEMAKYIAEPLGKIDKIMVWDGGEGSGSTRMAENVTRTLATTMDAMEEILGFNVKNFINRKLDGEKSIADIIESIDPAVAGQLLEKAGIPTGTVGTIASLAKSAEKAAVKQDESLDASVLSTTIEKHRKKEVRERDIAAGVDNTPQTDTTE